MKARWRAALDDAQRFIMARDPEEIGCLYHSPKNQPFVQPTAGEEVVPHYGRPGAVLRAIASP